MADQRRIDAEGSGDRGPPDRVRSLERQLRVEQFINALGRDLLASTDSNSVVTQLEASLEAMAGLTGAEIVSVFLERPERDVLERVTRWVVPRLGDRVGDPLLPLSLDRPSLERALSEPYVSNGLESRGWLTGTPLGNFLGASSILTSPLLAGHQRGLLTMLGYSDHVQWGPADVELARNVADLCGHALEDAQTRELLTLTYERGPIGMSIRERDGTFIECNQRYLEILELTREQAQSGSPRAAVHPDDSDDVEQNIARLLAGETTHVHNEARVPRADGTWKWVRVNAVRLEVPGAGEDRFLSSIEDIDQVYQQRLALEYAASHDSLTGVANRQSMNEAIIDLTREHGELPNMLIIDLDRFKLINDSMGHAMGDLVLSAVAARLVDEVREQDVVARLGGDEFAVLVPRATAHATYALAERLRQALEQPLSVGDRITSQTISIGVALGEECADSAELLIQADRAMYAAKSMGRNRHVVFDQRMRDEAARQAVIERELRHALDHDQLTVFFQPEFSIPDGRIIGAEALLRWHHPESGLLPASGFIDAAERTGLIDEVGRFALREACRLFTTGVLADQERALVLRINISGREFGRPELGDLVRAALAEFGLPPDQLCLEMTETTLMDSPEVVLDTLNRLRQIGVQFAIDDFGTGYSSLTYLKRFPVDALKIDRSFVVDIATNNESRVIADSIISLGAALSLQVVAEGVESNEQLEQLRHLGCERAQGYLVSAALPADEFRSFWLNEHGGGA